MEETAMRRHTLFTEPLSAVMVLAALASPTAFPAAEETPLRKAEVVNTRGSLPNGATSINETYGDWIVVCKSVGQEKTCTFSQVHTSNETGQRAFAIELQPPIDGRTKSVILLPFGLRLDDGVTLTIDGQTMEPGARFLTCVSNGCLVPIAFPTAATEAMKEGETMVVGANSSGDGKPLTFTISLKGFSDALSRVVELAK